MKNECDMQSIDCIDARLVHCRQGEQLTGGEEFLHILGLLLEGKAVGKERNGSEVILEKGAIFSQNCMGEQECLCLKKVTAMEDCRFIIMDFDMENYPILEIIRGA